MLDRFLAPASIAVIGASADRTRIRGLVLHLLRKNGFAGRLYPVNPSTAAIDGLPCYPSVGAIRAPVDLALVVIPAARVPAVLEECAAAGVRYAVVISSGFAEEGAATAALQARLTAIARASGMRISGPNGEGFHNEIARVSATFSPAVDLRPGAEPFAVAGAGRIGVVAQSGGVGFSFYNRGRALGLAFSIIVTTGNEADLTAADFFRHMAEDGETDAIMLFLEAVRDAEGFRAAAAAAARRGKPVVAVKVGRSAAGVRAAASHTASLAGWDAAYDAAFASEGMHVAADPDEAVAMLAALTTCPPARGRRAAVITVSGGAGAWVADALTGAGFALPELAPATQAAIRTFIPSYGSPANPVDITAQGVTTGGVNRSIELLSAGEDVDLLVVVASLASETRVAIQPDALAPLLAARRMPILFHSYTLASPFARKAMAEAGAAIHTGLAPLAAAARALLGRQRLAPPHPMPLPEGLAARLATPAGALAEHEAKSVLGAAGITLAPSRLARGAADLAEAAGALGFPLAAKLQSRAIAHKTEIGGVRLGLPDIAALQAAFAELMAIGERVAPGAVDGVLIEPMAAPGVEMILGVVRDAVFGPVLTLGAGGVAAELFRDVTRRLAPVDAATARAMVADLKSAALLGGFRGAPGSDIGALAALAARISALAAALPAIAEIELNPVIVHADGKGCTIADALIVTTAKESPA